MAIAVTLGMTTFQASVRSQNRLDTGTPPAATPWWPDWLDEQFREHGLTSLTSYQSPLYGYTVEWSDDWGVSPLELRPVDSQPNVREGGRDILHLARTGLQATLSIVSMPDEGMTIPERFEEAIASEREGHDVVASHSSSASAMWVERIVTGEPPAVSTVIVTQLLALDDGVALVIWLTAPQDALEAAFVDASGVLVDGEPIFTGIPWDEIEDALDAVEAAFADVAGVLLDGHPLLSGFQVSAPGA
jgi:hypothetical protein